MSVSVTATFQAPDNPPTEMRWTTDATPVEAMVAVGQLLAQDADPGPHSPTLLKIEVDVHH